jgi:uncharacterized protein DUF1579
MLMEYLTIFRTFWEHQNPAFMKKLTFALPAAIAVCISLFCSAQSSDDMKAMMAYSTPGEVHKMLARSAGTWTATVTMWMQPGAQGAASPATAVNEMIMGGRYLQSKNTGSFMGQPFEGLGITGYDNVKKVFFNTWIDNFGTGVMTMTGTWDDANKCINYSGSMTDPTSAKEVRIKEIWRFLDDNNQVLEMYAPGPNGGQEFKMMEIKYVRK